MTINMQHYRGMGATTTFPVEILPPTASQNIVSSLQAGNIPLTSPLFDAIAIGVVILLVLVTGK